MAHEVVSGAIAIVALLCAAYVETHTGDPVPYLIAAAAAGGYGSGQAVSKVKARKTR